MLYRQPERAHKARPWQGVRTTTCPECGTENRVGARFCELCQKPLAQARVGPAAPARESRDRAAARIRRQAALARYAAPALAAVALLLLLLVIWRFPRKQVAARPDFAADYPVAAMNKYFEGLTKQDYTAAYGMLSQRVRQGIDEARFAAVFSRGPESPVSSYTIKDTGDFDEANIYAAVEVNGRPEFYCLTREAEGWRISWAPWMESVLGLPPPV